MKILKEFKEFAMRGNVIDLAVGVIIGVAFGKVISSLVSDVLMPPIGLLFGKLDFSNLYLNFSGQAYASLAEAKAAGAATLNYGLFLNTVVEFIIIAFVIFIFIQQMNRLKRASEPTTKQCPFCFSIISLKATRCPNCTSALN